MQHRAYLKFIDPGGLYEALSVEAGREIPRTEANVRKEEKELKIEITAKDLHALRAALNSYLRWINLGYEIIEVMKNGSETNTLSAGKA